MVELPNATGPTGKTEPGDFFHPRQGLLLDHSGIEGVSSRIIFESIGSLKQEQRPFLGFWYCIVAIIISMVLLPCAASSTWTWVNQLLTLVQ